METILIATDFSEVAANAVKYGANLSQLFGSRIILLHAFPLPVGGYDSIAPLTVISDLQNSSLAALDKTKAEIIQILGFDPGIECLAAPGFASALIEETVKGKNIDAVVIGITGDAGLMKRHLIGSTVLDLARDIEVPLFIIPNGVIFQKINKITFALDRSDEDNLSTFLAAKYFCKIFNAKLDILSVLNNSATAETAFSDKEIKKLLSNISYQIITVVSDDPADAIQNHFQKNESDILMLSPKRHGIFKKLFVPAVTKQLVFSVKSPILTFHSVLDKQ